MSGATEHVVVQVTAASVEEASRIAQGAVEQRLAASAQIGPLHTWYRWKGRVHEADEHLVSLFTRRDRFEALARFVGEHHGYELPQVVAVPLVAGTPAFLRWIDDNSAPAPSASGSDDGRRFAAGPVGAPPPEVRVSRGPGPGWTPTSGCATIDAGIGGDEALLDLGVCSSGVLVR